MVSELYPNKADFFKTRKKNNYSYYFIHQPYAKLLLWLLLSTVEDTQTKRIPVFKNSLVENTGLGCRFLLQGVFLTQRSNLCFL